MRDDSMVLMEMVSQHLAANPGASVQSAARACGVSRQTVDRVTKRCVGRTFRGLRDEYRHRAAVALLAERPPLLVKEIAFALGFSTPRSFARWARRIVGRAPGELRRAPGC